MVSLKQLTNMAKKGAEMNCINDELLPVLFLDTPDGLKVVGVAPSLTVESIELQKQAVADNIRSLLTEWKATQYVYINEGYGTEFVESAKKVNYLVRDMPPEDRYDIAMITAVKKGKSVEGYVAVIDSLKDGTRKIRKWEKADGVEGRFAITNW